MPWIKDNYYVGDSHSIIFNSSGSIAVFVEHETGDVLKVPGKKANEYIDWFESVSMQPGATWDSYVRHIYQKLKSNKLK